MPSMDTQALYQRWLHSHEEDSGNINVFRPATYDFPPARGRTGFELRRDGTLVQIGIGATDRPAEISGTWELNGDRLVFHTPSRPPAGHTHKVLDLTAERLVLET